MLVDFRRETHIRKNMSAKTVAVIGAGLAGIGAVKALKEEGIEPVCFERTGNFGGLWRYHDDDTEGLASVMKTTVFNTSKEMGAISDMPPPDDFPNYLHHKDALQYVTAYAEKYDILRNIQYDKEVIKVEMAKDYDATGRMTVVTRDTKTECTEENVYDGVFVCTGHHVFPNMPSFPGQEKFKGTIIHSRSLKKGDNFADHTVVVVGAGSSGIDAAVEISRVAKQVYLSTRRGTWVVPRVGPNGLPFDVAFSSRFYQMLVEYLPLSVTSRVVESVLEERFDHAMHNLKPKHRFLCQHPTVSDTLPVALLSGLVKLRGNVKKFAEDGIIFENEDEVTKVDSVVFATGYKISFPFLSEDLLKVNCNRVHLYKYMYPPYLPHATLTFIGLIQPVGAGIAVGECQCRLAALVMNGKVKLPSRDVMEADIRRYWEKTEKRYVMSERHTIETDHIPYSDEICELFGAKPDLLKYLFTDPKLFWALMFGPSLPYQYRLEGPHSWPGARDAMLSYKQRLLKPLNQNRKQVKERDGLFDAILRLIMRVSLIIIFFRK